MIITAKTAFVLLVIGVFLIAGAMLKRQLYGSNKEGWAFVAGVGASSIFVSLVVTLVASGVFG